MATPITSPPVVDDLPTLEELMAEALIARPLPAVAATVAAPVAIARVHVAATDWQAMTSAQLRKECSKATPRIAWRNAHGKGRHLRKEEMLRALS
ncbi:MAG: hypothetical protein KME14_26125 [Tildeniella torsiva UHER 1998/13D]|nr:hypothetical protein [Tildeniella torsiva UHER 1998/13D]